jgi:hypothetical protein
VTVKAPAIWRRADVLRHLTNQLAKRRLAEQEIGRLLVLPAKNGGTLQREGSRGIKGSLPDLPQCSRSWPPPVGFLDPTRHGGTLASRLGGNSLLRRLTASGPARSLLGPAAVGFSSLRSRALVAFNHLAICSACQPTAALPFYAQCAAV